MFKGQTGLILGATGSWGRELTKQLLEKKVKEIRAYSRNEFLQVKMQREFNDHRIKFILGDVRDYESLNNASKGVNFIMVLAALKHVPLGEEFCEEFLKTNVNGVLNAIKAAVQNKVSKVVYCSTDKAANPINLYGLTKAIGEKLIVNANNYPTKFMCIRGGNVLGTNGSVVPLFIDQIKKSNKITITDREMTRYFLTIGEAIKLVILAYESNISGGIIVMRMPSCRIIDLAEVLIDYYGNKDTKIEETGIRPGEKLHETLVTSYESPHTYEYSGNYYVICRKDLDFKKVNFKEYTSNSQNLMSKEEIKNMLKEGGFLL
jgi:FlaA1/EpsC-like NDP-sugar epimerase